MAEFNLQMKTYDQMSDIPRGSWQALAGSESPLMQYDWLLQLERSQSVSPRTDWQPHHIAVYDKTHMVAAAPFYRRTHNSAGEFVFDYAWADAAEQLGLQYFPKLIGMSPLSPIPAFTIMVDDSWCSRTDLAADDVRLWVLGQIRQSASEWGVSSIHLQFTRPNMKELARRQGFEVWTHAGFCWYNHGYSSWDDFLGMLSKDRRRNARRERRKLRESGVQVRMARGSDIPESWLDNMYGMYRSTTDQFGPWAARFLTREFFLKAIEAAGSDLVFAAALRDGDEQPVGIAMLLTRGDELLGRYWGCREQIPYLHFECCYYAPIEWAIQNNMRIFDPGMGGEHKIHRGFEGTENCSLHWFSDPRMQMLFAANIHQFNDFTAQSLADADEMSPLRKERLPQ